MEIIIKVNSTYNNTIVSALYKGKILKTISTGSLGFKKAKRASTLAAQTCGEALGSWLLMLNKNLTRNSTKREANLPVGLTKQEESNKQVDIVKNTQNESFNLKEKFEYALLLDAKKKLISGKQNQQKQLSKKGSKTVKDKTEASVLLSNQNLNKNSTKTEKESVNINSRNEEGLIDVCNNVSLLIAGVGYGKFGVIRGLSKLGIKIKTISDITAIPHNGCKPPKMRRK